MFGSNLERKIRTISKKLIREVLETYVGTGQSIKHFTLNKIKQIKTNIFPHKHLYNNMIYTYNTRNNHTLIFILIITIKY